MHGTAHAQIWSIISAKIARYGIDNTKAMSHTQCERSMSFGRRSPPFGRRFISFGRRSISFGRRSISRRSEGDIVQGSYGDLRNRHIYIYWFCHSCPETPTAIPFSQATPFAERGRVWSRWNHRVVATTAGQKLDVTNQIRALRRSHQTLPLSAKGVACETRAFACEVITFEITKENRKQPPFWCTTR